MLIASFKDPSVRKMFDRKWHKMQLNILRFALEIYVDCQLVSTKLFNRNSLKRKFSPAGKVMVGNLMHAEEMQTPPKVCTI